MPQLVCFSLGLLNVFFACDENFEELYLFDNLFIVINLSISSKLILFVHSFV